MDQVAQDPQAAATLIVEWLHTHDALAQQYGEDLWRLGALRGCQNIVNSTRHAVIEGARVLTYHSPMDATDTVTTSPVVPQARSAGPQRPTGAAHLGKARMLADTKRLMDFQFSNGLRLAKAKKGYLLDYAKAQAPQILTMAIRRTWAVLIAEELPNDDIAVEEALDEARLRELYHQAEHAPQLQLAEEKTTTAVE